MFYLAIFAHLSTVYVVISRTIAFCNIDSFVVDGQTLRNSAFASFPKSDIFRCAGLCVTHSVCKSFSLNTKTRTCYLSFKDSTDTDNVELNADYIQSDINRWPKSIGGPCSVHTCHPTTFCAVGRSATGTVCKPVQFMNPEEDTDTYYELVDAGKSWDLAKTDCEDRSGHLAIVEGTAENEFLQNTAIACGYSSRLLWFGATDAAVEGTWRWIDGNLIQFTSWQTGQPNNPGEQDCAGIVIGVGWKSNPCSYSYKYICEIKL
ncbi:CD209 antigen-like [Haliotis asinina]|uniref:CD209 antigen-like n=1 Tax=Haliotis asinina TaxID=109174 RepID=UPI0035323E78